MAASEALRSQAASFPERPGVYIFKDPRGKTLYVGKANVLRERIRSYFGKPASLRHARLVEEATALEFVTVASPLEAFLLEANLIKVHQPPFNIQLKEGQRYPFIAVTLQDDFPRIFKTRDTRDRKIRYFGPYADAGNVDAVLELLQKIVPFRTCTYTIKTNASGTSGVVPPSALPGGRACLLFQLHRCEAPCIGEVAKAAYRKNVDLIVRLLEGKQQDLLQTLEDQMAAAAAAEAFERAAVLRDRLRALRALLERQVVHHPAGEDCDVLAAALSESESLVCQLQVRQGRITGRAQYVLTLPEGSTEAEVLSAFSAEHYGASSEIPPALLLPVSLADEAELTASLSAARGSKMVVVVPIRGLRKDLVSLAVKNAQAALVARQEVRGRDRDKFEDALVQLQTALNLPVAPRRIEGYDISHLQGQDVVSSLVAFQDGRPDKKGYRKFKLRLDTNDDVRAMRETLTRRAKRAGENKWLLPDLILIDGGPTQLAAARAGLAAAGHPEVTAISLAKAREEVYITGRDTPVLLPRNSEGLFLLQRVRDESHRFAGNYQRTLRSKRATKSLLDDVVGLGPVRKRQLLTRFGSVRALSLASVEDIAAVNGISRDLAQTIKATLG